MLPAPKTSDRELPKCIDWFLASPFSFIRIVAIVLCLLSAARTAFSDVKVEPSFGHPYVFADRIVFTSVDGTHLIAIDKKGRLQWELTFPDRLWVQHVGGGLTIQTGRHVYNVDLTSGRKSELFTMPENELLVTEFDKDFLAAADSRFDHNHLRVINPVDFSTAWDSSSIESIVAVTSSTIVAVTADRKHEHDHDGYHFENSALRGFGRSRRPSQS